MTFEELEKSIAVMIGEGDNNAKTAAANAILSAYKELDSQNTVLTKENTELTERNKTLNDANAAMFLSTLGKGAKDPEPEPEKTPKERFAELFDTKYYPNKGEKK